MSNKNKRPVRAENSMPAYEGIRQAAAERGHENRTAGAAAGGLIGAAIGSFAGPFGAMAGGALGGFIGASVGQESD